MNQNLINEIKKEMYDWYGFDLTEKQIEDYLNSQDEQKDYFDTVEREDLADYLAKTITGMSWPMNMDKMEYKKEFYSTLKEKAPQFGYVWLG